MKKFLLSVLALSGLLVGCSPENKGDRWEPNTQTALAESERRVVLVEEYTGQRCVNCPEAAKELHEIGKEYPKHLIIVAMHSEHSGLALKDLASQEATRLAKQYTLPTAIPGVMISRKPMGADGVYTRTRSQWASDIANLINTRKVLDIEQTNLAFDEAKDEVTWSVTLKELSGNGTYKLTAWLVEDVVAPQTTTQGTKKDYLHHNVHRAVLTPEGGKEIKLTGKEQKVDLSATSIKAKVKDVKKAKIVVFAQAPGSDEILSASIIPFDKEASNDPNNNNNPSDDPNKKPKDDPMNGGKTQEEIKKETDASFALFDEAKKEVISRFAKGQEIEIEELEGPYNGHYEFVTMPFYIVINKPEAVGEYKIVISKEGHENDKAIGITTLCANGQCTPSPEPKASWDSPVTLVEDKMVATEQNVQIHFGIPESYTKEETYRMRVTLYKNNKEITHLIFFGHFKKPAATE